MASSARQLAQNEGRLTYHGRPCAKCRLTEKYTKQGSCVDCAKRITRMRVATGGFKKYYAGTARTKTSKA